MAELIRILLGEEREARDLSEALARRGLGSSPVEVEGRWEVALALRHERTAQLLTDVTVALVTWLDDRRRSAVPVRVGARSYLLEANAGLSEEPVR